MKVVLFLTSSPCDDNVPQGVDLPCIFDVRNGFVENLQACFEAGCSGVIIAADPDHYAMNDEMAWTFEHCFAYHGMTMSSFTLVDSRNEEELPHLLATAGVVVLAGGHVPTENAFFRRIGLRELLQDFDGIVMGISAGTMNCAEEVYAQPEEAGESVDPHYERFIQGLGLTHFNVLPHYQKVKNYMIDGQRLFEDVTYGDSWGRIFYALVDGSYILVDEEGAMLFGEAYAVSDGRLHPICGEEEFISLDE